jgi:hypothetical protein|tara:strand:- start:637 stop:1083 length:447 start_codon:yes stop_codon:yes gene_type:complete
MVSVTGSGKNKRAMAKSIAEHCIDKLMPRLKGKLDINISLIPRLIENESLAGDCERDDESRARPREFSIRVDSTQDLQAMLETVSHEMVHVKQYARGELKDLPSSEHCCKWKGKTVNLNSTHYYDQPWEIEAHGRERGLFVRWVFTGE